MVQRTATGSLSDRPNPCFILRRERMGMRVGRTIAKFVLLVLVVTVIAWTGRDLATAVLDASR